MAFASLSQRVFADEQALSHDAVCPTMDVVLLQPAATATEASLWRVAGSAGKVWQVERAQSVAAYCWSPDGQHIICSTTSGQLELLSVHTGATVLSLSAGEKSENAVQFTENPFLSWQQLPPIASTSAMHTEQLIEYLPRLPNLRDKKAATPDNTFVANAYGMIPKAAVATPKLTLDSAFPAFPRLPPQFIAANTNIDDVKMTTADPTLVFHQSRHGQVDLYYAGCFHIGQINFPENARLLSAIVKPGAAIDNLAVGIVWQSEQDSSLNYSTLELPLTTTALEKLAKAYTAIHSLLSHAYDCITEPLDQWNEARAMGEKWVNRIANASESHNIQQSPVLQMLTLLLTGRGTEALTETFTLKNAERDFTKWETTLSEAALKLRDATYQSLTPAVERVVLWLSEIRSWALDEETKFGLLLDAKQLSQCIRMCQELIIRITNMENACGEEERKFVEFCKWVKHESEVLNAKDGTPEGRIIARYDVIYTAACLEGGLKFSAVEQTLARDGKLTGDMCPPLDDNPATDKSQLEQIKEALRLNKPIPTFPRHKKVDLGVPAILNSITKELGGMFSQTLDHLDAAISPETTLCIDEGGPAFTGLSCRLHSDGCVYICSIESVSQSILLHRIDADGSIAHSTLASMPHFRLVDADFFDDLEIVLAGVNGEGVLATILYADVDWDGTTSELVFHRAQTTGSQLLPRSLAVNGRPGRRIAVIVGTENQLEVFDMEEGGGEDEEDDVEMV